MNDKARFQRALYYESHITNLASQHGIECAADEAAVMVDGASNAMTRIKGPRAAAEFAMRLGDRIVGNHDLTAIDKPAEKKVEGKAEEKPKRAPNVGIIIDVGWCQWLFFGFVIGLTARFF